MSLRIFSSHARICLESAPLLSISLCSITETLLEADDQKAWRLPMAAKRFYHRSVTCRVLGGTSYWGCGCTRMTLYEMLGRFAVRRGLWDYAFLDSAQPEGW